MKEIPDFELDPETLEALERMASQRGCTVEQLVAEALDQYILRETGQNN
jgi:predicted transcriptional regulator